MVTVECDEHVGFFQNVPQSRKVFLQKTVVFICLVIVKAEHGNIQIGRIGRADILENIFGFDIKDDFFHTESITQKNCFRFDFCDIIYT